jgi:hypothetical protein
MSRSRKSFFPIDGENASPVLRGTPALLINRLGWATHLMDRLELIYGNADSRTLLCLAQRSRTYRELIRRYSNDSML